MKRLSVLLALAGVGVVLLLLAWFDVGAVWAATTSVGWGGFLALVAWQGALFVVLGLAWVAVLPARESVPHGEKSVPADEDPLSRLAPAQRVVVSRLYGLASASKPEFDRLLAAVAAEVGGVMVSAPLKDMARAVEKIDADYAGVARRIKDIVRGTIQVATPADAARALQALEQAATVLLDGRRDLLNGMPGADGYRDMKVNVDLGGGLVGEVQINLRALADAKDALHALYARRSAIERASMGRLRTDAETASVGELNARMNAAYSAAWGASLRASETSRQNAASDTGAPLRRADSGSNTRGGSVSQAAEDRAAPGTLPSDTGIPSTSKYSAMPASNTRMGSGRLDVKPAVPAQAGGLSWAALLIWGRMVRDAATTCLPFSPVGGYVIGARALTLHGVAWPVAAAGTVVDVTAEIIAQLLFALFGVAVLVLLRPGSGLAAPLAAGLLVAGGLLAAALWQRRRIGAGLRGLGKRLLGDWFRQQGGIERLEAALSSLYAPRRLGVGAMLHLIGWFGTGFGTWISLRLLGAEVELVHVLALEALLDALVAAAFVVPGAAGVQEAGYIGLGALFGVPPDLALSVSLLRRAKDLCWGVPILALWQWRELRRLAR